MIHEVHGAEKEEILHLLKSQERNLPFVWQLEYDGMPSYAVGTKHNEPWRYTSSACRLLDKVTDACFEATPETFIHPRLLALRKEHAKVFEQMLELCPTPQLRTRFENFLNRLTSTYPKDGKHLPGVDGNIHYCAQRKGLTVHALETVDEVTPSMEVFKERLKLGLMIASHFVDSLESTISQLEEKLDEMDDAYRTGDERALYKTYARESMADMDMFIERNHNMARRSLEHMGERPTLVAVGVAHLAGAEPTMLTFYEDAGARVRRIQ